MASVKVWTVLANVITTVSYVRTMEQFSVKFLQNVQEVQRRGISG